MTGITHTEGESNTSDARADLIRALQIVVTAIRANI